MAAEWKDRREIKMDRYTRLLFGITCPYSGERCETEIDCLDCLVEKEERRIYVEEQAAAGGINEFKKT